MNVEKLNLLDSNASEIRYKISRFPDGQQSIRLNDVRRFDNVHIEIVSRLNSFMDLELIICAKKALDNLGATSVSLYTPYFLGARSDRKFEVGSIHYLKDVICPIVNSLDFKYVKVLDPHSDVLEACLNSIVKVTNYSFLKEAFSKIDNKNGAQKRVCLVSPDAGAYKKIFDVAKHFGISNIITATKVRDLITGNIVHTEVPVPESDDVFKYVIVDDICDGGRTFIEIAKTIKNTKPNAEIYLIVSHGIFSAGFTQLGEYFKGIYCTNSVRDIEDKVNQINVF
jgi:ribose-phosphate pyrophosphokinase